jgi:hypothetical protein
MDIGSPAIFAEKIALHPTVAEELVIIRTPTASDVRCPKEDGTPNAPQVNFLRRGRGRFIGTSVAIGSPSICKIRR